MVGGGDPFYLKFWVNWPALERIADFEQIITRSASAVRPSEKSSINTNRKSPTRFPMSLRWSSYVAPKSPKGGSNKQNGRFPSIIAILLKKVCYRVSLCENCQWQSCRAFTCLTIHAKIIGGGRPQSTWNFGLKWPRWSEIADFLSISLVAPQP